MEYVSRYFNVEDILCPGYYCPILYLCKMVAEEMHILQIPGVKKKYQ